MLFDQENLLMMMDERVTPNQWEMANLGLIRQLSDDNFLWDAVHEDPISSSSSHTHLEVLSVSQNSMEDLVQDSAVTHHSSPRKKKLTSTQADSNYDKNICAYITKKAVQCFISQKYRHKVQKLCLKRECNYAAVMEYYKQKYQAVFGITLLALLISPQKEEQVQMKSAFRVFLRWFLREKYLLYLLKYGKMSEKEKYIEFKNKYLLYINKTEQMYGSC